jgi:protein TonB
MSVHAPRWRAPLESYSKLNLPPGKTTPRFEIQRFGSGFTENLREWFRPAASRASVTGEPQSRIAREPASIENIWKKDTAFGPSQAIALAVHAGLILLVLFPLRRVPPVAQPPVTKTFLVAPGPSPYSVKLPPGKDEGGGGGGGGEHSLLPTSAGRAPKFDVRQIAPPAIPHNANPILVADASLLGPPELQFPSPNLNTYGDPLAKMVNDSGGPGGGGGMGDGDGPGIGPGRGPGLGPGWDGGVGGRGFKPGVGGVGFPACAYCPDAKYSEEARKAKFQGVVLLQVVVTADGRATNIEVVRGPGLGLEEQAVAAVKTWRFKPAFGPNHVAVPTSIAIEVQFRLL